VRRSYRGIIVLSIGIFDDVILAICLRHRSNNPLPGDVIIELDTADLYPKNPAGVT